jgi:hypothetical protein
MNIRSRAAVGTPQSTNVEKPWSTARWIRTLTQWSRGRESFQASLAKEAKEAATLLPPALLQDPIEARPYRVGPEADESPCYHGLDLVPDAGPVCSDEAM